MRIGIMLRHYQQHGGGVKVYTSNLLKQLLYGTPKHQYILMYKHPSLLGTYAAYPNVEEVCFSLPSKLLWDQVAVPWLIKQYQVDLIFNPKFTVPILTNAKKVFVIHGSEWFAIPETFEKWDVRYAQAATPIYCRCADAFIAVSKVVKQDIVNYTGVAADKITPVYNGFDREKFHLIQDSDYLESIRQKYRLPDKFILWTGQIYPPKNIPRLLQAFARVKDRVPHDLVLAGKHTYETVSEEMELIEELGIQDRVHLPGWMSHEDLPALYNLADLFTLPSLYEGFGIPLIEAMACGCPVLTSNTASPPEVIDSAGFLVNPLSVDEIAQGIETVLCDSTRRQAMIDKGLERARDFSWERCAQETLQVLESV